MTIFGLWFPSWTESGDEFPAAGAGLGVLYSGGGWSATTMGCYQWFTKTVTLNFAGNYHFVSPPVEPGMPSYKEFLVAWDSDTALSFGRGGITTIDELVTLLEPSSSQLVYSYVEEGAVAMKSGFAGPFDLYDTPPAGELQGRRENFTLKYFLVVGCDPSVPGQQPMIMAHTASYSLITVVDVWLEWTEVRVMDDGLGTEIQGGRSVQIGTSPLSFVVDWANDPNWNTRPQIGSFGIDATDVPVSPGWGFSLPIFGPPENPYGSGGVHSAECDVGGTLTEWLTLPA